MMLPNGGEIAGNRYGPVLLQAVDVDSTECRDVLDPMYIPGRGAPKKKLKSNKNKSKRKCTLCKGEDHDLRRCSMREEVIKSNVNLT